MFSLGDFLQVEKNDRSLVYRTYYIFLASGLMNTLFGTLMPFLGEAYGLSYSVRGMLLSSLQAGNLIAIFASGVLPFLLGRKRNTVIFTTLMVLGNLLLLFTGNPLVLALSFAFVGIGRGTLANITNVVVSAKAGNRTAGLNLLHAAFAIGAVAAPLILVATLSLSWKVSVVVSALCMAVAVALIALSSLEGKPQRKERQEGDSVPRSIRFWLCVLILFFYIALENALVGWLVTYFIDAGVFPEAFAAGTQAILWVMILIGRLSCAAISNRVNRNKLILVLGLSLTFFFLLMIIPKSPALIILGVLGVGLSMSGIYPTTIATLDPKFSSSTIGMALLLGTATFGGVLISPVIGMISERAGIEGGIAFIFVVIVLMFCCIIPKLVLEREVR